MGRMHFSGFDTGKTCYSTGGRCKFCSKRKSPLDSPLNQYEPLVVPSLFGEMAIYSVAIFLAG